jgi:hypothetical protein
VIGVDRAGSPAARAELAWRLAAVGGGLGMVVAITTRQSGPLLVRPGAVEWSDASLFSTLSSALAVLAGLVLLRWWPWLLLLGSLAAVPALLLGSHPYLSAIGIEAGAVLVPLAVLAAAQELIRAGRAGLGAAVAGATVGAVLTGGALTGAIGSRVPSDLTSARLVLVVFALAGAAAMIVRRPWGGRITPADFSLADVPAAALVFLPALAHTQPLSGLLGLDHGVLRRGYLLVALVGVVTLGVTGLVAALAGPRASAAAVTAALVQVGVAVPVLMTFAGLARWPSLAVAATLAGVAAGAAAALLRRRIGLAVLGGCASAAAVLVASTVPLGRSDVVAGTRGAALTAVLLGLLVATATVTVAATAPVAAASGRLPVVLGPIVAALVVGGNQVLYGWHAAKGNPADGTMLDASVTLLLLAAVAALCLAAFGRQTAGHDVDEPDRVP